MTKLTLEYESYLYVHKPIIINTPKESKVLKENTKIKISKTKVLNN